MVCDFIPEINENYLAQCCEFFNFMKINQETYLSCINAMLTYNPNIFKILNQLTIDNQFFSGYILRL